MPRRTRNGALLLALGFTLITAASAQESQPAARPQPTPRAEVNIEVQVHLLVTAEGAEGAPRVPQSLDAVVGQLKAALPSSDFRLAAAFVNRVRNGGSYDVKTVGGLPFGPPPAPNVPTPTFFQHTASNVRLLDDVGGQPWIHVQNFWLGTKIPIQMGAAAGDKSGGGSVIQYENTGLGAQFSAREGEPTLVGTLNTSRPGQLFAVVITVRRTK